jgi:hypothetical protein
MLSEMHLKPNQTLLLLSVAVLLGIAFYSGINAKDAVSGYLNGDQDGDGIGSLRARFERTEVAADSERLSTLDVEGVLGADELLYYRIPGDGAEFYLYIAKWKAGNRRAYEATQHPPDWCWPANGWTCKEGRSGVVFSSSTGLLKGGEWRRFIAPDNSHQETLFWCVTGGRVLQLGFVPPSGNSPIHAKLDFSEKHGCPE